MRCVLRPERDAPEHARRSRSVRDAPRNTECCEFTHFSTCIHLQREHLQNKRLFATALVV